MSDAINHLTDRHWRRRTTLPDASGRDAGFTLIELAACLLIMAMLVAVAALSLRGRREHVAFRDVIDHIQLSDRLVREHARRFDSRDQLVFDLNRQRVEFTRGGSASTSSNGVTGWFLASGYRITAVDVQGVGWLRDRVAIDYSRHGWCPTYALQFQGPVNQRNATATVGGTSGGRWLVVAGMSGQMRLLKSKERVNAIFESLVPPSGLDHVRIVPGGGLSKAEVGRTAPGSIERPSSRGVDVD